MKRKFSNAMKTRVARLTDELYRRAVVKALKLKADTTYFEAKTRVLYKIHIPLANNTLGTSHSPKILSQSEIDKLLSKKAIINDEYLKLVLKCTDEQLQEILIVHENGAITRAQKTLEAIKSEITHRSIFGSDPKLKRGVINEYKKSSKRFTQKTLNKRNKTHKS